MPPRGRQAFPVWPPEFCSAARTDGRARLPSLPRCKAAVSFTRNPTLHIVGIRYAAGGTAKTPRRLCAPLPDKRTAGFPVQGSFFGDEKHSPRAADRIHGSARSFCAQTSDARRREIRTVDQPHRIPGRTNLLPHMRMQRNDTRPAAGAYMTGLPAAYAHTANPPRLRPMPYKEREAVLRRFTPRQPHSGRRISSSSDTKRTANSLPVRRKTDRIASRQSFLRIGRFIVFFQTRRTSGISRPAKTNRLSSAQPVLYLLQCRQRKYVQLRLF